MNPLFAIHKHYGSLLLLLILIVILVALFKGPHTKLQRIVAVLELAKSSCVEGR